MHQHFVPGRVGSPLDVVIDSVGVALGVLLWRRYQR
jgi:VanZ family protein